MPIPVQLVRAGSAPAGEARFKVALSYKPPERGLCAEAANRSLCMHVRHAMLMLPRFFLHVRMADSPATASAADIIDMRLSSSPPAASHPEPPSLCKRDARETEPSDVCSSS